jgi:hypothetical protein
MALTGEQLEAFKKQKIKEIADAFRQFVRQEYANGELKEWPRLYYVQQGKSGFSDGAYEHIRDRVIPIWGHREVYLHCDTLELLQYTYSNQGKALKYSEATDERVAQLTSDSVNLHVKMAELKKLYRYEKHGSAAEHPDRWLKQAIFLGLNLSYADFRSHFRGFEHEKVYETKKAIRKYAHANLAGVKLPDLTEKKFIEIKTNFTAVMAQKIMARNQERSRYNIWPETNDDLLEDE